MDTEKRIAELEKQVKDMKSYILGLTGNLNYKNTVARFAKEAVIQQVVQASDTSPDSEIVRTVSISGDPEDIEVLAYPDQFIFLRDKDNNIYKVAGWTVTL